MTPVSSVKQDDDVYLEDVPIEIMKDVNFQVADLGSEEEHSLTLMQACKTYPMAILWATILTMTIIMEGYDQALMGNLFAYPTFLENAWMAALGNAAAFGSVVGLLFNGHITERFGHRRVIIAYLTCMAGLIFIVFFAPTIGVLCAGQVLLGVTWGGMAILGTAYASEICPLALRAHLTALVNMAWVIGGFVCNGLLDGLVDVKSQWGYRIPFAVQWAWLPPLIAAAAFAPDSPWWLIRKGRVEDAEKSLGRLSKQPVEKIQAQIQLMIRTNALEREMDAGSNYWDCLRGTNFRRTEIAAMILSAQTLAGEAFAYSPVYFFVQAGFSASQSFKLQLGGSALALVGTTLALFLLGRFGRRTLLLTGLSAIVIDLLIIACLATTDSQNVKWAQAAFAIFWLGLYSSLLGPESFCMAAEISATRLRAPTLSIARNVYVIINVTNRVIEPYLINPDAGNLKGKMAFYWLGTASLTLLWAFLRLPETRGRTYEELDLLFKQCIPAWRFSKTDVGELEEPTELSHDQLHAAGG